jgi:two-component system sensor histidine kinase QseC
MTGTAWFSLRRRLLWLLLGGVSACWLVTLAFSFVDAHREIDELFDAQLAQAGQTLLALAGEADDEQIEEIGEAAHKYQRRLRFQIWNGEGRLLLRSENAPDSPLTAHDGFSEVRDGNGHWRYFSRWNADRDMQVQVAEDHHIRDELTGHIAWRLLQPALFGLPLLALWLWVATRRGLASLDGVAQQIELREPQQLQPLIPASAPDEIRPMLEALNGLFLRVEEALEAERRFTADAAHELRTPLAALQAQLQVALRARGGAERDCSLANLQAGLTRASHLVEQMLQLARLDPERGLQEARVVDLGGLAAAACADLGPAILARELDFDLAAEPGVQVQGQAEWLGVLIRNLVDNAVRYTPAGGSLRVAVDRRYGHPRIAVADSGPGIPPAEREAVLRRFHRLGHSEQPGSGLGLSIVLRIAELHGARLALGSSAELGGLEAQVFFPG